MKELDCVSNARRCGGVQSQRGKPFECMLYENYASSLSKVYEELRPCGDEEREVWLDLARGSERE